MFGISGTELFLIIVFALLIFGPDKLPQMGRTAGRFMREFKRAQDTMESVIRAEMYGTPASDAKSKVASAPTAIDDDDDDEEEEDEE